MPKEPKQGELLPEPEAITVAQPTPMVLLQMAMDKGASIEQLEKLMALHERWVAAEALKAYTGAMVDTQAGMQPVRADLDNPQTKSKYASYAALDKAIRPIYSKHGFSLSFNTAAGTTPEWIKIICKVSHVQGHTEMREVEMPCDGKGAKGGDVMTKTHAVGAAMSYGMRYLLKFIFNIAVGEADTDGNAMPHEHLFEMLDIIANSASMVELQDAFKEGYKEAAAAKDKNSMAVLIQAKDKRKAELNENH